MVAERIAASVLLLVVTGACRKEPAPPLSIREPDGGILLSAIDTIRGAENGFGSSAAILPLESGALVVAQGQQKQLRFFDSAGRSRAAAGRFGSGPGEFRMLSTRYGISGDTVWMYDPSLLRISGFDRNGVYLFTKDLVPKGISRPTSRPPVPSGMAPGGDILAMVSERGGRAQVVRVDAGGGSHPLLDVPAAKVQTITVHSARENRFVTIPFASAPIVAIAPNGERIARVTMPGQADGTAEIDVTMVSADGSQLYAARFSPRAVPVSEEDKDSALATLHHPGITPEQLAAIPQARALIPSVSAPVQKAFVGLDGALWILVRRTHAHFGWWVLAPDGKRIDSVIVASGLRLNGASSGVAFATRSDSNGFVDVVRLRIIKR
jgi:hypothetical protein